MVHDVSNGPAHEAFLALGSNLGDRIANLKGGMARLESAGVLRVEAASSLFASDPEHCEGGEFLNAVVRVRTTLEPLALLDAAKAAEREAGRLGIGRDARPLDIDILYFDDLVAATPQLTIPHVQRLERCFVVTPLAEVCGDRIDPVTRRPIYVEVGSRLLPSLARVRCVAGSEWLIPPTRAT